MAEVSNTPQLFQPGFRLIDGAQLNSALAGEAGSTDDGITASTTQTLAGAKQLTLLFNRVTTANASDAVKLPPSGSTAGLPNNNMVVIANDSGATVQVFPGGSNDIIDGGAAGAAANLTNAKRAIFWCTKDTGGVRTWVSLATTKST